MLGGPEGRQLAEPVCHISHDPVGENLCPWRQPSAHRVHPADRIVALQGITRHVYRFGTDGVALNSRLNIKMERKNKLPVSSESNILDRKTREYRTISI